MFRFQQSYTLSYLIIPYHTLSYLIIPYLGLDAGLAPMNPFMGCMREMNINGLDLISSLGSNGRTAIYNNTGKDTSDYYIDRDCNAVSSKVFTAVIVTCGHKKITNKSIVIYWIGNCYHLCNVVFVGRNYWVKWHAGISGYRYWTSN